jgi:phospholipid/cholesterol/gamma-HCH transport system permease protein
VSAAPVSAAFVRLGHATTTSVAQLGRVTVLVGRALRRALRPPRLFDTYLYQLLQVGVRSLPLTLVMSVFAGMVLAFQFGYGLERFGARLYIGQVTVTAILRELGPILTALAVGARIAAGIAAELGGMAVTEQVDAVRALGADPLERLVAPRVVAVTIALPLLTICADAVATTGAMVIASATYAVPSRMFLNGVYEFVTVGDFTSGLFKSVMFGFASAAVACSVGLDARGGTEGVGRAATRAVVASALTVLGLDLVLTKILLAL